MGQTNAPRAGENVHRFAVFTACCTFALLAAGALVTSNDAGLAVPDWPLSYGSLMPPMVGGIFYEHGHRMVATFVGLLSIILAAWLWRVETRAWLRWLGVAALGAVITQGILGGLTVLFFLPPAVSSAHAALAQLFFCTVCSIALFTSGWWRKAGLAATDAGGPGIHLLAAAAAGITFVQLILGAAFRHNAIGIAPHLIGAAGVATVVFVLARALRRRFPAVRILRNASRVLHVLLGTQLLLGAAAWWSRVYGASFPQPVPVTVTFTVMHTVTGALVLASTVLLTLVCHRIVLRPQAKAFAAITAPDSPGWQSPS
jgi:cytochrome c oxidase assembly protein subunit 15